MVQSGTFGLVWLLFGGVVKRGFTVGKTIMELLLKSGHR